MLHKFAGGDDDGDAAVGAPILIKEHIFGYASASPLRPSTGPVTRRQLDTMNRPPRAGILYRINRDGSDYSIVDNEVGDPRHSGCLFASKDSSAIYCFGQYLFKISTQSGRRTV